MFEYGKRYLNIGSYGESGFGSWLSGFWVMVLGFLVGQVFVTIGLLVLVPDILFQSPQSSSDIESAMSVFGWTAVLITGFLFSIPGLFFIRKNPDFNPWGAVMLVAVFLGMAGLIGLGAAGSSSETSEFTSEIMGHNALTFGTMLGSFLFPLFFLLFASRIYHSRTATSMITAWRKIRWSRILLAAILTISVLGAFTAIIHFSGMSKVKFMFGEYPFSRFIGFAMISLLLIPFQSAAEEVIFRGYLNQGFSQIIKNRWIVFAITSLLFTAMHLSNPESLSSAEGGIVEHILMMSGYFLFGFILCIIVYFEGGLEAVIGVHAANNLFAAIFVNYEGSVLPTPSLFLAPAPESDSNIAIIIVLSIIAIGLFLTRRKQPDFDAEAIVLKPAVQRL